METSNLSISTSDVKFLYNDLVEKVDDSGKLGNHYIEDGIMVIEVGDKRNYICGEYDTNSGEGAVTINGRTMWNDVLNYPYFEGFPLWYIVLTTAIRGVFGDDSL